MLIVFVTAYYNHHQACLAQEFYEQTNHNFRFIESKPMEQERKRMGWGGETLPDYVIRSYEEGMLPKAKQLILEADAVLWGSCPFALIRPRLQKHRLTFAYSERIFKNGSHGFGYWGRVLKYWLKLGLYQENHDLLCASAFAAGDYQQIGLFRNRARKWGYFPEAKIYDNADSLIRQKKEASLLWAGRLIDWKHPELAIELADRLHQAGYSFELNLVGNGDMEKALAGMIADRHLEHCVRLCGKMSPAQVRSMMEQASIFLFTSDRNEGWGAVLNESMNSGCAVIASSEIGAVPYLIEPGYNGMIFESCNAEDLFAKAEFLLNNPEERTQISQNAYKTIVTQWNAHTAVSRLLTVIRQPEADFEGVCQRELG